MTEIEKYILNGLESGIHPKLYHPESDILVNVSHVIVMPDRFHLYIFDGQSGHVCKLDINKYKIPRTAYDDFSELCDNLNGGYGSRDLVGKYADGLKSMNAHAATDKTSEGSQDD